VIRAVANKPLDLTDEEFQYYSSILDAFGANVFQDTFEADDNEGSEQYGWITLVKPPINNSLPLGVVFFLFNVMLNQRMRKFEQMMMDKK
jgi:hypothetical protein